MGLYLIHLALDAEIIRETRIIIVRAFTLFDVNGETAFCAFPFLLPLVDIHLVGRENNLAIPIFDFHNGR